jgi:leucyl aminopeptidase
MPTARLSVQISDASLAAVDADVLVIPVFEEDDVSALGLSTGTQRVLGEARRAREFKSKPYELFWLQVPSGEWRTGRVLAVGGGSRRDYSCDRARKLATAAALSARGRGLGRVAFLQRAPDDRAHDAQAIVEGAILGAYDGDTYKTNARDAAPLVEVQVIAPRVEAEMRAAVERGRILGECSNLARSLANEPGNLLPPRVFAERAKESSLDVGLDVDVLDEHAIEKLGMGLVLGVARGSAEPPRVIVIRYTPAGVTDGPVLGLVGKGVTFDTGGISIKPAEGMDRMKDDMAGGAAVIAAMRAIKLLQPRIRVIGVVPTVENMPGSKAIRPGDVLTSASGKTVEVLNTDAEGRLILGDGLWYARELGATHLVDVATLTGACVVALGKTTSGLFATPEWWLGIVRETANRAGDRSWPMPLFDDYLEQLRSEIADLANVGGRPAGAVTAAMFLKEFTGGLPWAHFDIAGTAWAEEPKPYQPKGASGIAVRTLAELAFTAEKWAG